MPVHPVKMVWGDGTRGGVQLGTSKCMFGVLHRSHIVAVVARPNAEKRLATRFPPRVRFEMSSIPYAVWFVFQVKINIKLYLVP